MENTEITDKEKSMLFWASFMALMAAGVGFVFRGMIPTMWEDAFQITTEQVGSLTGAALWPIAVSMILFSLIVDKIGYRFSMFCAFTLQAISVVLTINAQDYDSMFWACICAGLGHGIVEAVINPLCATMYKDQKSKMLNILHAAWPAGIVFGGICYIMFIGTGSDLKWEAAKWVFWIMLIPVLFYGIMFILCKKFPVDERVENNVSYIEMLREFGGLGIFVAATFLFYEITKHTPLDFGEQNKLVISIAVGGAIGLLAGLLLRSSGKFLFFLLCLIMIPLATAEIATDGWIRTLMEPIMGATGAAWALVLSAGIMMVLRFFAGVPLRFMNPPQLLLLSSVFSILGLYALSSVPAGPLIFGAFVLYAIGQTFYWPTVLGFVSEQFPKGGAMTLNTVSAMGLLTVGIFGFPFLGAVQTHYKTEALKAKEPALVQTVIDNKTTFVDKTNPAEPEDKPIFEVKDFFGFKYDSINTGEFVKLPEMTDERREVVTGTLESTSQSSLKVAAVLPAIMAVAFLLIIIWYKMRGGYKPVNLDPEAAETLKRAAASEL